MVTLLCTCNWGLPGVSALPPHHHYLAGLATMPDGEKKWVPGLLAVNDEEVELREFVHFEVTWDWAQAEVAIAELINGERRP